MVSVLMPVFNGATYIADAVASVQRQPGAELELLIHDDGSTDDTAAVLRVLAAADPRIVLSGARNRGPAASRNHLLTQARADYVAFLDHDDLWPEGRLARQVARLAGMPAAPAVLGETLMFDTLGADGAPANTARSRRVSAGLLQAGLFPRTAATATGPFATEFAVADDFDFVLRMVETCGPMVIDPEVAVWYRLHPDQRTGDLELSGQATARALAHSLRRRRAAGTPGRIDWRAAE
jgi:glycosyltransferase involved in cell wall biosynthesis